MAAALPRLQPIGQGRTPSGEMTYLAQRASTSLPRRWGDVMARCASGPPIPGGRCCWGMIDLKSNQICILSTQIWDTGGGRPRRHRGPATPAPPRRSTGTRPSILVHPPRRWTSNMR
jgi:hypothetical protein